MTDPRAALAEALDAAIPDLAPIIGPDDAHNTIARLAERGVLLVDKADHDEMQRLAVTLADAVRRYFDDHEDKAVVNMQPLVEKIEALAALSGEATEDDHHKRLHPEEQP